MLIVSEMFDGTTMNPNNDLKEAIQTGLVNPIRESFAKEQESLKSLDRRLKILIIMVVVNIIISLGILGMMIVH